VKYSHQIINDTSKLEVIWPYLWEKVESIETVRPSIYPKESPYVYYDIASAQNAYRQAYEDTMNEDISIREFLSYTRRLFLVSGIVDDDLDLSEMIRLFYDIGMYMEVNKDEV
tara:strand:+ start:153 stop:491 length:339 start_codon:yes stop_codon:yes gene_type:complete